MIASVVGYSLTDVVRGLILLGLVYTAVVGAGAVRRRTRSVVARWRDRRHVARCWRAVR